MKTKTEGTTRKLVLLAMLLVVAAAAVVPVVVGQGGPTAAGKITTLVPVNYVQRAAKKMDAAKEMPVFWGDLIVTERGGRVRVRLEDGSILSVGSQSQLRIEKHDAQAQSTSLDLVYGRVRATATRIVAPGGEFKVRTKAAVAGVVGTEEYVEASEAHTMVIALGGGNVAVTSTDPRFPDPVLLSPGETTSVLAGRPPAAKRAATTEELGRAFRDTEADTIAQLSPNVVLPGATLRARLTARRIGTATGFAFDNAGIRVQAAATEGNDAVPVTIDVARDVPPGRYTLTITRPEGPMRATLIVSSPALQQQQASLTPFQLPAGRNVTGIRGAKVALDASQAQSAAGTPIVSYQWRVLNTQLASNDSTFNVNTSVLPPGNYTVQLVVVNDRGQTATQENTITVTAGSQPAEILQLLGAGYESLQPNEFLKYFDELRYRNFAGFSAAIEDSFRNQLESMRVFQRAVNCSVIEEQDQAVCQADFELRFTQKNQQLELLDAQGQPVPPGTTPPPGATLGKALQTGTERTTVRYERADAGWKIVDYATVVSCPGGASATGINVGSCILAAGSAATPTFTLGSVQVLSTDLPLGGTVTGSLTIVPVAGFNGSVNLSGQAQVSGLNVGVQFSPVVASAGAMVNFTVIAPTTAPAGFQGATPFTLVLTGTDTSSNQTASANVQMQLQPDFTLSVTPNTTASSPAAATHNSNTALGVSVQSGAGFGGPVFVDFPNLPAGFSVMPGTVNAGQTVQFPVQVSTQASPGPAQIIVRGASGMSLVKTVTVFFNVTSDFTLTAQSSTGFAVAAGSSLPVDVTVVPISGFAGVPTVDFSGLPAGFVATPPSVAVQPGGTAPFSIAVPAGATTGNVPITIRGTFGTAVRNLTVNAVVQGIAPAGGLRTVVQPGQPATQPTSTKPGAPPAGQPAATAQPPATATPPTTATQPVTTAPADSQRTRPAAANPLTQPPGQQPQGTQPQPLTTPARPGGRPGRPITRPSQLEQPPADQPPGVTPQPSVTPSPAGPGKAPAPVRPGDRPSARTTVPGGAGQPPPAGGPVERGSIQVPAGGCMGLRLAGGMEMQCDRGADVEFRLPEGGNTVQIGAEGVRSMGLLAVNQEPPADAQASDRSAPGQAGMTYLIQLPRGRALLRLVQVRSAAASARLRGQTTPGGGSGVILMMEWRILAAATQ